MVKYFSTMMHFEVNPHFYRHFENVSLSLDCNVTLKNKELWKTFSTEGTEMIITKSGRRMFPSLDIKVDGLCPDTKYHVFLEMESASRTRFKYSSSGGWFPAGSEEAHSMHRFYSHPDSPAKGAYWMSQTIKFSRVKLTNTISPPCGQIVLASMHKYQPKILIIKENELNDMNWTRKATIAFPETQFIAVTAYQNENITKLKIDNNPFAKGFRESGQAKCKRRKTSEKKDMSETFSELLVVDDLPSVNERLSPASSSMSVSSSSSIQFENNSVITNSCDNSPDDRISHCYFPTPMHSPTRYFGPILPIPTPTQFHYSCVPYYKPARWMHSVNSSNTSSTNISRSLKNSTNNYFPSEELPKPVKLTDFSIRAITGCE